MKSKFLTPIFSAVATATVILIPQSVHAETTSTPSTKTVSIHDIKVQVTIHHSIIKKCKMLKESLHINMTFADSITSICRHLTTKRTITLTLLKVSLFIPAIKRQMLKSVMLSKSQVPLMNKRLTAMTIKLKPICPLQKSMPAMTKAVKFQ